MLDEHLTIRIPSELKRKLTREAVRREMPLSWFLRRALNDLAKDLRDARLHEFNQRPS